MYSLDNFITMHLPLMLEPRALLAGGAKIFSIKMGGGGVYNSRDGIELCVTA